LLTGQFIVQSGPSYESTDIYYAGRIDPLDPPQVCYLFQLSQAHLDSTVRVHRPGAKADFLMERPLWRYHRVTPAFRPI